MSDAHDSGPVRRRAGQPAEPGDGDSHDAQSAGPRGSGRPATDAAAGTSAAEAGLGPSAAGGDGPPPPFPDLDEEDRPQGPRLDVMRFARGAWQRRWLVIAATGVFTLAFLVLALLLPRAWRATAILIEQTHQDGLQVTSAQPFEPQHYDLQTFIDTIKLPSSLDETMRRTGVSVLRRTLAGAIDVSKGEQSGIFSIHVTWKEPETAARIANTVADLFIENSARIRRTDIQQTLSDYRAQLEGARKDLDAVNRELAAYADEHGIANLEDQFAVLVELLAQTTAASRSTRADLEALRAAKARSATQLEREPEMVVTSSRYRSPFKQRLSDYQWELREARTRYTENNPKIMRLQERIATLKQLIAESDDEVAPENVYEINPKRAELYLREQQLIDDIGRAEAQAEAQRETIAQTRGELDRLAAARSGWQELISRQKDAERLVDHLAARVAEVRVSMARNESGFAVLEAAEPPDLPEPSLRKLIAAAGVVLGGGFGLLLALLLELLDPYVRTARDAQGLTGCNTVLEFERAPTARAAAVETRAPAAPAAMLFRRIVNDLNTILETQHWQLGILSGEPGAGRSLIAANLAATLGLKERPAVAIDADLRGAAGARPAQWLGAAEPAAGLTEVLAGRITAAQGLVATAVPGVQLLGTGRIDGGLDDSDEARVLPLGSSEFARLATGRWHAGAHRLYDLPPLNALEPVSEAAGAIGDVLLVARSGRTRRAELRTASERLAARGVEVRAVIVTMLPPRLLTTAPLFAADGGSWVDRLLISPLAKTDVAAAR